MRWSKFFIPTMREKPKNVETLSHMLALKAGLIRPVMSGVYNYLPLGWRVLRKIIQIVREEMDRIGGQEFLLGNLTPANMWEETGRLSAFGEDMFRLHDRAGRTVCLAPTHEEVITDIARKEIKSYKDLPQIWYQIHLKFRDEKRPRAGPLRARQFIMKDSYSLDRSFEELHESYKLHREAYLRIFKRCGLEVEVVEAASGVMGGAHSEEFMVRSDAGEDEIVVCDNCGYKASHSLARTKVNYEDLPDNELKKVHTPVPGTVEEITKFLKVKDKDLMKSLLFIKDDGKPVFVLVDGAHDVSEDKLRQIGNLRPATSEEIKEIIGAEAGYISPIGKDIEVYADESLKGRKGLVTGANEDYYHYTGVNIERDVKVKAYLDLKEPKEGDLCVNCGRPLNFVKTIEVGHIFELGTKYSESMGAYFVDKDGKEKPIVMGSYGIGIERIMMSVIETWSDKDGIVWPTSIAPFKFSIIPVDMSDEKIRKTAEEIYDKLVKEGIEVLYDDRDERHGVKFKDNDLIGIPYIIVLGKRLKEGFIEVKNRKTGEFLRFKEGEALSKIIEIGRSDA